MNFAEGKGPKQQKKSFALGQFVTVYGNDGTPGAVNPAVVPYPAAFSNGQVASYGNNGVVTYVNPGSLNPGLNVSPSVNSNLDVSLICAPAAAESLQDLQSITVILKPEAGFSGQCTVTLQGTYDRYTPNAYYTSMPTLAASTNWSSIVKTTVSGSSSGATLMSVPVADGILYNAYRLVASGGTGIIDWAIPGMFIDLSAMGVGQEAAWANGSIGQININDADVVTISGGAVTGYSENNTPYENVKANHDYIG